MHIGMARRGCCFDVFNGKKWVRDETHMRSAHTQPHQMHHIEPTLSLFNRPFLFSFGILFTFQCIYKILYSIFYKQINHIKECCAKLFMRFVRVSFLPLSHSFFNRIRMITFQIVFRLRQKLNGNWHGRIPMGTEEHIFKNNVWCCFIILLFKSIPGVETQ